MDRTERVAVPAAASSHGSNRVDAARTIVPGASNERHDGAGGIYAACQKKIAGIKKHPGSTVCLSGRFFNLRVTVCCAPAHG